ncbi:MAG TPA: hypothetical protein DEQ14_11815 [Treponema sp.]|nr:hypothetical protein [Treponema sp.]
MPWRLIGFIITFGVFLVFAAFNLENSSDINFGFASIKNIPVFITAFSSFILGMLCALPVAFRSGTKKKQKIAARETTGNEKNKNHKEKKSEFPEIEPIDTGFSGGGPYGVN